MIDMGLTLVPDSNISGAPPVLCTAWPGMETTTVMIRCVKSEDNLLGVLGTLPTVTMVEKSRVKHGRMRTINRQDVKNSSRWSLSLDGLAQMP
jgi:hypothetical protein